MVEKELFDLKMNEFKKLKINISRLKKRIKQIEQNIEKNGIEAYYSINDEVLEYALAAHTSLRILGYIKTKEK